MKFAASDTLSELVWSPHNGLSLKCADCSLADEKPFLLWNLGPSNMVPSPSQSMRCGIDEDKKVEGNFITSQAAFHLGSGISQRVSLTQYLGNSARPLASTNLEQNMESRDEMEEGVNRSQNANHLGEADNELCDPHNQLMMEMAAEVHMEVLSEAHVTTTHKSACLEEPTEEVKGAIEGERKNKIKTLGSTTPIMDKLEYTAENNLQHPITEDAYHLTEERLLRGCSIPLEISPENGWSQSYPLKSIEKALSDSNAAIRFSLDVNNSQESVESCNSAGLLGKRQCNFDQQLISKSKRIKEQSDGCPASTSLVGQDSSFMNWMSNMVNGFSKCNQEEGPSLDLTLAHSSPEHTRILQETIICHKHQDSVSRNMGFETIFKSLYCPNTKLLEAEGSRDDCSVERLQDLVHADKTNIECSPINNSSLQNGTPFGRILMKNEKTLPSPKEVIEGQSDQPWNLSVNTPTQKNSSTNFAEDKAPSKQQCYEGEDEASSSDSLVNHKITVSDDSATYNLSKRNNMLGSLWITRFSTKISSTSLNLNHSKRDNCQARNCPGDCTRANPQNQTGEGLSVEEKNSDIRVNSNDNSGDLGKDLLTIAANAEFSLGFQGIHEHKDQPSMLKLNSLLPSQGSKSSEAIASVFARRLDALKHIIPSEAKNDATCTARTCFFCGKSGHTLRNCSEVMETELQDLLRNISSYDWREDSPSLCIRCFQPNHWAIMCPLVFSNRQQQLVNKMYPINFWNAGNQDFCLDNEGNSCLLDKEDHLKVSICSGEEPFMNTGPINPMSTADELSGKRSSSSNEKQKQLTSYYMENKVKEHHNFPLCNFVSKKIAEVPEGMFDAVRRLQVSRADILKWRNSNVPLSHLEGLFLRLRLGKCEAGLGGKGYHVACITVEQAGEPAKDSKTSISVTVGGIKCLVGSQYVSNNEFLEDELMVWWSGTLKSGGKIPSKEDLESKFQQRIKLGF